MSRKDAFNVGEASTLDAILQHRERRYDFQYKLGVLYPNCVVVALKENIPGPVKNNEVIAYLFNEGHIAIVDMIQKMSWKLMFQRVIDRPTGIEGFYVVSGVSSEVVKHMMLEIEMSDSLGRLHDIDVMVLKDDAMVSLSRTDLGYSERSCLVCHEASKACGRSRKHTLEELHTEILKLLENKRGVEFND